MDDPRRGKVCVTVLPKEKRAAVWKFITTHRPETLQLIEDPTVQEVRRLFPGTRIWLPLEDTGLEPPQT